MLGPVIAVLFSAVCRRTMLARLTTATLCHGPVGRWRSGITLAVGLTMVLGPVLVALAASPIFTTGQNADLVLGQGNFTSSAFATTQSGLNGPEGVAVDPTTGKVFVADRDNSRVLRFASPGSLSNGANAEAVLGQPNFTSNAAAVSQNGMNFPNGVWVDSGGRLWVADTNNQRVLRFDGAASKGNGANADGVLGQANFTSSGTGTTQNGLSTPLSVAVDSGGRLWVADASNNRVLRFDGAAGKGNGANADGVLGQANFTSNAVATTQNGMRLPIGVAVDSGGRLWVADLNNNRVLRFDGAAGKGNGANADGVLGQANFTSNAVATTQNGMRNPISVAVDSNGRLWVGESNNNRVVWFDGAAGKGNGANADGVLGQANFTSSGTATTQNGLNNPAGVTVDLADNLWVADFVNHRVLHFSGTVPTATATPTPVIPEPPVWLLFASGLGLLAWRVRRRR